MAPVALPNASPRCQLFCVLVEYRLKSRRIVFKTDNYEGTLYKRSPYFVGAKLWDNLTVDTIELPDVFSFKARLKRLNNEYVDLLKSYNADNYEPSYCILLRLSIYVLYPFKITHFFYVIFVLLEDQGLPEEVFS